MDERVLVEVYIPAAMCSYDIYLPLHKPIGYIKKIVLPMLEELTDGMFIPVLHTRLYKERMHVILADENTLQEAGIAHGDRLLIL